MRKLIMPSIYTEVHLVEQPALQLMQHELGWDVVNFYGEWDGGTSKLGRYGKREGVEILNFECLILNGRKRRPALQRLNPDLPVEAIGGAVEERGILNVGSVVAFGYAGTSSGVAGGYAGTSSWILNGRGKRLAGPCLNPALTKAETNREIVRSGFPLAVGSLVLKQSP